jgi:hypothetical protein
LSAQAPLDRLAPRDFYVRVDRLRADWHPDAALLTEPNSPEARYADYQRQDKLDRHERKIAAQLRTLKRLIEQLPPRFYERAISEYRTLERGRISESADWLGALHRLRQIIGQWDSSRPPLVPCPECRLEVRGQSELRRHRLLIHEFEED